MTVSGVLPVTTFCAEHGISRKTFYEIRRRSLVDGPAAATEPRSRRPKSSPSKLADEVRRQAIGVRAALDWLGGRRWPTRSTAAIADG